MMHSCWSVGRCVHVESCWRPTVCAMVLCWALCSRRSACDHRMKNVEEAAAHRELNVWSWMCGVGCVPHSVRAATAQVRRAIDGGCWRTAGSAARALGAPACSLLTRCLLTPCALIPRPCMVCACRRTSIRILGTVGEPINPEAWWWYYDVSFFVVFCLRFAFSTRALPSNQMCWNAAGLDALLSCAVGHAFLCLACMRNPTCPEAWLRCHGKIQSAGRPPAGRSQQALCCRARPACSA